MIIELIDNQDEESIDLERLEAVCGYISSKFDPDNGKAINVILVDDKMMRELNSKYRNICSTTDVLSFSYLEDSISQEQEESRDVIGEVYISPAAAKKNSSLQKGQWDLDLEIILLAIHGMLHIFGYDHENDEERAEMYGIQDSLIHEIEGKDWNSY